MFFFYSFSFFWFFFFFSFFLYYSFSCIFASHHCHLCIVFWFVSLLRFALRFFSIRFSFYLFFLLFLVFRSDALLWFVWQEPFFFIIIFSYTFFFFSFFVFHSSRVSLQSAALSYINLFRKSVVFLFINFTSFPCSFHSPPLLGLSCLLCVFYLS